MGRRPAEKALASSLFLCVLLAMFLLPPRVALADDSEVGATGGSIYSIKSTDVRMAAETVQAVCFGGFAEYRVDFRFVNGGKARVVKLGFPFLDTVAEEHGTERPVGFQAWQNGRPLAVRAVAARGTGKSWKHGYFVHEARFPHGATMITVSYLESVSGSAVARRRDGDSGMTQYYQYWLHTGSSWKGTIGAAVVRYSLADSFRGRDVEMPAADLSKYARESATAPSSWTKPLPRTYQWRFTDFEPKPAHASGWWKQESRFDVTLGFSDAVVPGPTQATWKWSRVTGHPGSAAYGAVQDGLPSTFWHEGAPGPGIGQWVQARFRRPMRLRELRILPGNNESDSTFKRFARPKTLKAVFSDGSAKLLRFKDAPTLQRFPVHVTTRTVRFVIKSVYLGTDYPATCISEVDFGTRRAPGYASFRQLIGDPSATGRLTAWAGPAAPAPRAASRMSPELADQHPEDYTLADFLGIVYGVAFPAGSARFKEPSSLAAITARSPAVRLPERSLVGDPTEVNALSYWTYEIRYSSGIDLVVNTRVPSGPRVSLASEQARETEGMDDYADRRKHPFELATIGHQVVGVARRGDVPTDDPDFPEDARVVPAQAFWRTGDTSYHLYARSKAVTADRLVAVARSLILPRPASVPQPASSSTSRLWLAVAAAAFVTVIAVVIVLRRRGRKSAMPSPGTPS